MELVCFKALKGEAAADVEAPFRTKAGQLLFVQLNVTRRPPGTHSARICKAAVPKVGGRVCTKALVSTTVQDTF